MRLEIRLSGTGGQGMIMAGVILAEAAGIFEEKNVAQTQSYGPEARGGASKSEVVISDAEIYYPRAYQPDILVCMSQQAYDKYKDDLKENGILIVDSFYVNPDKENVISLPISVKARELLGKEIFANMVMLGVLCGITDMVKLESLKQAVKHRFYKKFLEENLKALEIGFEMGREWKNEHFFS